MESVLTMTSGGFWGRQAAATEEATKKKRSEGRYDPRNSWQKKPRGVAPDTVDKASLRQPMDLEHLRATPCVPKPDSYFFLF